MIAMILHSAIGLIASYEYNKHHDDKSGGGGGSGGGGSDPDEGSVRKMKIIIEIYLLVVIAFHAPIVCI